MPSQVNKFQIGDRVKLVSNRYCDSPTNPHWNGCCGQVVGVIYIVETGSNPYCVQWGNGNTNSYYSNEDLELVRAKVKEKIKFSGGF